MCIHFIAEILMNVLTNFNNNLTYLKNRTSHSNLVCTLCTLAFIIRKLLLHYRHLSSGNYYYTTSIYHQEIMANFISLLLLLSSLLLLFLLLFIVMQQIQLLFIGRDEFRIKCSTYEKENLDLSERVSIEPHVCVIF